MLIDTPSQQFHIYYYIVSNRRMNRPKPWKNSTHSVYFDPVYFLVRSSYFAAANLVNKKFAHTIMYTLYNVECTAMGHNSIHKHLHTLTQRSPPFGNSNSVCVCAHAKEKLPIKVLNFSSLISARPTKEEERDRE